MFADKTDMTSVILDFITTETETPKNMTKCDGVGMTQTSVPEIDAGGESNRCGGEGGGGCIRDRARRGCHIGEVPSWLERP